MDEGGKEEDEFRGGGGEIKESGFREYGRYFKDASLETLCH